MVFVKFYWNQLLNRVLGKRVDASKFKLTKTNYCLKFQGRELNIRGFKKTIKL